MVPEPRDFTILLSRAIPGTRLPTYLAAGLLRVPAAPLSYGHGAACSHGGRTLVLSYHVGMMVISGFQMFRSEAANWPRALLWRWSWLAPPKIFKKISFDSQAARLKNFCVGNSGRCPFSPPCNDEVHRSGSPAPSISLPTLANPGMYIGGFGRGIKKYETLADLARAHPSSWWNTSRAVHSAQQQFRAKSKTSESRRKLAYRWSSSGRG